MKPEQLFLVFSLFFGIIITFTIPPLGGGDEGFHYHRIASVVEGETLNKPVSVPSGIVLFIDEGHAFFHAGMQPPFQYSDAEKQKMKAIKLDTDHPATLQPNAVTVHHPLSYVPQIIAFELGLYAGLSPYNLLYIARIAGLATGIYLTFLAIRIIPNYKYALCAIALLPAITTYRSFINADVFINAVAYIFLALVYRENKKREIIGPNDIALLAIFAFILAQCKSAYLLLTFFALLIPKERFGVLAYRILALAIIILPGFFTGMAWMVTIKQTYFSGISYRTWGGNVNPDMQTDFILHHPVEYLAVFLRTVFETPLIPKSFMEVLGDVGPGYSLHIIIVALLCYCLIATILSEAEMLDMHWSTMQKWLAIFLFACITAMGLTILYIQWTGLGLPIIKGFQGRYFFPILPLLFVFIKRPKKSLMSLKPGWYIVLLAVIGLTSSIWQIATNYY